MLLTLLFCIAPAAPALAQADPAADETLLPDPQEMQRVEAAVDRALEYLLKTQNADGSWPSWAGRNHGVNAFCLLAFLGRGHVPGRGPYRQVVDKAVTFILSTQTEEGLYKSPNPSHGPMYEHALATLAMIEAYGGIPTPEMRQSVQKAVDLIVQSQNPQGGWRYQPRPADADLSVTVMQVVALRAAMNAKLDVPQETVDKAVEYVRSCAHPDGGYAYQPGRGPNDAQTAAGLLSMYLLGAFDDPTVEKALTWMAQRDINPNIQYFWYTNYYAMQAHFQAGGEHWAEWHPRTRKLLLDAQMEDGSWPGYSEQQFNGGEAQCYSTAVGAMCLEVYMHYLPAYQR